MIKKPSDTEAERLWMKINGKEAEDYTINVVTGVIEIRENIKDENVMADDKQSDVYVKFGDRVAKHWVKPEAASAAQTPTATTVKPYASMYKEVSQATLVQSDGTLERNAVFVVMPKQGLHLALHISSDHSAVDKDDLLNGLTEMLHYINGLTKDKKLNL